MAQRPLIHTKACQQCGAEIDHRRLHPLQFGPEEKEIEVCDRCCPNCFGGQGKGPTPEQRHTAIQHFS